MKVVQHMLTNIRTKLRKINDDFLELEYIVV